MAAEILNELLAGRLSIDSVIAWLTSRNDEAIKLPQLDHLTCSKGSFVLHVINFIRNEALSVLKSTHAGLTPVKQQRNGNFIENSSFTQSYFNKQSKNRKVELFPHSPQNKGYFEDSKNNKQRNESEKVLNEKTAIFSTENIKKECNEVRYEQFKSRHVQSENRENIVKEYGKKIPVEPVTPNSKSSDFLRASQFLSPIEHSSKSLFCHDSPFSRNSNSDPASPIHIWNKNSPGHVNRPSSTISLGDYIVGDCVKIGGKKKGGSPGQFFCDAADLGDVKEPLRVKLSKNQKRRIKPTRLNPDHSGKKEESQTGRQDCNDFGSVVRPSEPSSPFREVQVLDKNQAVNKSFQHERDLLRQERLKQQTNSRGLEESVSDKHSFAITPTKSSLRSNVLIPQQDKVTHRDELLVLSDLYCHLLDCGLLPNVTAELNFIISLLAVRGSEEDARSHFLGTVHNCVFFAASVLNKQCSLLELLDSATLLLLQSSEALEVFAPDLCLYLETLLRSKDQNIEVTIPKPDALNNVTYRPDEDSRDNFPSDQAFYSFRKQRDAFYEVLQVWEREHEQDGWCFGSVLGMKVRSLLMLNRDPANYVHLARLFRSQLLITCCLFRDDTEKDDDDDVMLAALKDVNPKKYALLRARLIAPSGERGPCPLPIFPGHQEFFRDFILEASHSAFNQHLADSLANELLCLDNSDFSASDVGDTDTSVDENTRNEYLKCLCTARLVAKFLGFINFLPYHTNDRIPDKVIMLHSSLRIQTPPPFDVRSPLEAAIASRRLVLTVPWVVKYLAMLDKVGLQLPYYTATLRLLFSIHRYHLRDMSAHSALLLRLCLGWLFDLPHFPEGAYFSWISEHQSEDKTDTLAVSKCTALDSLGLVDERCVYTCCPYWSVLRTTLAQDPRSRSSGTLRHITPVAAEVSVRSPPTSTKQLELQLEESFFHGHPASMRKTVEFVAERVASAFVKHICNVLLPDQKTKDALEIRELIAKSEDIDTSVRENDQTPKEKATDAVEQVAKNGCKSLRQNCVQSLDSFCTERITTSLKCLLAEDVVGQVVEACSGIALRLCRERVISWVRLHITPDLFLKDYQINVNKAFRGNVKADMSKVPHIAQPDSCKDGHDDSTTSPRVVINLIREVMWSLLSGKAETVTSTNILELFDKTEQMLCQREDVISSAIRIVHSITLDLIVLLAAYRPQEVTPTLLERVIALWSLPELTPAQTEGRLDRLFSPRNMAILEASADPDSTWTHFSQFVIQLLLTGLLTAEKLEDQCVALLRYTWPQEVLQRISTCIKEVIEAYQKTYKTSYDEFVLLMELISELCDDMEQFDDF